MFPGFFIGTMFLFLLVRSVQRGHGFGFRGRSYAAYRRWHAHEYDPHRWGWDDRLRWDDPGADVHPRRQRSVEPTAPARRRAQSLDDSAQTTGSERLNAAIGQFVSSLRDRLHADPVQEGALAAAVTRLRDSTEDLHGTIDEARDYIAGAVRTDVFDRSSVDRAFQRLDEALSHVRTATGEALAHVHGVLDHGQRETLGSVIESPRAVDI